MNREKKNEVLEFNLMHLRDAKKAVKNSVIQADKIAHLVAGSVEGIQEALNTIDVAIDGLEQEIQALDQINDQAVNPQISFVIRCALRRGETEDQIAESACKKFGHDKKEYILGVIAGATPLIFMDNV